MSLANRSLQTSPYLWADASAADFFTPARNGQLQRVSPPSRHASFYLLAVGWLVVRGWLAIDWLLGALRLAG